MQMPLSTSNTSRSPKTTKCKDEDSDITFVAESSKINGDGSLDKRAKEKKKQQKNDSFTGNSEISSTENGYVPSHADESESLLKVKKKKHKKQTGDENEHHNNVQSDSFLNGINLTESLETDDSSVNDNPDKRKKKKRKQHEGCNPMKKKKRRESIEFLTQDIFRQPESDSCISSTPIAKKLKKKNIEESHLENSHFSNDEKEELVSGNTVENSSSNKVYEKCQNGSLRSLKKSKEKCNESSVHSELHVKADISDVENGHSSSSIDSQIISPNKTSTKKKLCKQEVDQHVQDEEQNDDNMKEFITIIDDKSATDLPILKKKKKKRKDISDFDPWRDSVSSEFRVNKKDKKAAKGVFDVDPLDVSLSSGFNSSESDKKENKELLFQKANAPFGYVDVMKMNDSKQKLGLYSPSHSATLDTSSVQEMYDRKNVGQSNSSDLENTSYVNSIFFTDDSKGNSPMLSGSEVECSFSSEDDGPDAETMENKSAFGVPLLGKYFDINFKVPELHKILNRASKPTAVQREVIAATGIKVKQGKFVKAEDKQIRENWKHFIEVSGLEDKPEYFFRLDNQYISPASKRNFLYHLARDMPERTPYAVYKRFKLIMAERKKGRYTSEENEFIKKMMKQKEGRGFCVKKIAEHLQRPTASVEKRIKKIQDAHTRKIRWKANNAAAFIKYLLKVTKIPEENISQLKERHISHEEWEALSKKLDNVPVRILRRAWMEKLYPALFIPGDFCDLGQVKLKLVKMLHENNETEWKYVNWKHYASKFEGLTSARLYSLMKQLVRTFVPEHKRDNLKRCIKTLLKLPDEKIHSQIIHKIEYSHGTIRELREET